MIRRLRINNNSKFYWFVFLFMATVLTLTESTDLYKDIQATTWPTLTGHLDRSYNPAVVHHSQPEYGPFFEPLRSRQISFSYEINGQKYSSRNISFGFTLSEDITLIGETKKDHPNVKVYFNPTDPSEAVLIPGPKIINIGLLTLSIISVFYIMKQLNNEESA